MIRQQSMTISQKSLSLSSTAFARQFKPGCFSFGAKQGVIRGHLGLGVYLSKGGRPHQMSFSSSCLEISLTIGRTSLLKKYALIYIVHGLIKNEKDNGTKRHMMKNHSLLPHPSPDPGKHLTFSLSFPPQFRISQQHSCTSISRSIYCKHY